jgi:transcription termination/antitermination protein NusG
VTTPFQTPLPDDPLWYAIQTRYRFEKRVTTHLQCKGIEAFLPVLEEIHRWSDRQKRIDTPLFSGYTFARINPASWSRMDLLKTIGVIGLIEFAGQVIPIPTQQIDDLQRLLSQKVPCALHPFLKRGQRVRIRGGCLDGLEGILDERGEKSLVISVESIQRSLAIRIEGYELELI